MPLSNHERVGEALELLKTGLMPFIEREFKARYGDGWAFEFKDLLSDTRLGAGQGESLNDVAAAEARRGSAQGAGVGFDPCREAATPPGALPGEAG